MEEQFENLPEKTKAGMTKGYFMSLKPQERSALTEVNCIEPGCTKARWQKAGSFYCEEHTREHSRAAYMGHRPDEDL